MSAVSLLFVSLREFDKVFTKTLNESQIKELKDLVRGFAIASAVAGASVNIIPGGSILAVLGQTGLVWTLYVQINKQLGISMKKDTAKFIGSAILTNMITNAGTYLLSYVGAFLLSFIPVIGQVGAAAINAGVGYVIIYVAAILYLNLLTKVMKVKGDVNIEDTDESKEIIKGVVKEADIKSMIKEGKESFKEAKESGEFDRAKNKPRCPACHTEISLEQRFCSNCGAELK